MSGQWIACHDQACSKRECGPSIVILEIGTSMKDPRASNLIAVTAPKGAQFAWDSASSLHSSVRNDSNTGPPGAVCTCRNICNIIVVRSETICLYLSSVKCSSLTGVLDMVSLRMKTWPSPSIRQAPTKVEHVLHTLCLPGATPPRFSVY